jgi:asparagine synthase (glutamine-hydrolysing)
MIARTERGMSLAGAMESAMDCLACRGPDHAGLYRAGRVALGHRRLAIIDTSAAANQPMTAATGRYTIVYNGEVYNFRELRSRLGARASTLRTHSDTEVVLELFASEGPSVLEHLNGFFALAIHDRETDALFLARDRFGIKPLLFYQDDDSVVFASEMAALLAFPLRREIDDVSLFQYLQLSFVPAPYSILKNVHKLEPGCCLTVKNGQVSLDRFAAATHHEPPEPVDYRTAQRRLVDLLSASVERQLVSDVPLGAFLSGGLDSSIIVALAARQTPALETFSIGYSDDVHFDEAGDAARVARALGVRNTVFNVSRDDLYGCVFEVLDRIDEPFSDSSALAVYILSRCVRRHVTVALSGDGADEVFGGYNRQYGEYLARRGGVRARAVRGGAFLWRTLPQSRDTALGNTVRKLDRFARRAALAPAERYWSWSTFTDEESAAATLSARMRDPRRVDARDEYQKRKQRATGMITGSRDDMNDVLRSDIAMVLPDDMLRKVDSMSMAHSLEVRVPFLDNDVVAFAARLPSHFKIGGGTRKRILRDAFRDLLPDFVLSKPKHGFEVPLMGWLRSHLHSLIRDDLLGRDFVSAQGIFDPDAVAALVGRLESQRPGDIGPQVWSLVVFQYWWKRYMA